ncbi:hypothetical protein Ahy_B03g063654 [Arachis hypogaea]|uniref:RNase H type-1 domain-containing protein n=1 Tax=Arachis hypogaea TaxID=3818 RepID=A0A444ZXT6_ARAHY|nr:hypothetical protein Ahy_B03g063654 [Arachis hypogaea]
MLTGRLSHWALLLSEYDVKLVTSITIKSQVLADLLSICPEKATIEELSDQISGTIEIVHACNEEKIWTFIEQVWRMMKVFDKILFEHVLRTENKHANVQATFASRVTIQNGQHALEHQTIEYSAREERMSMEAVAEPEIS